MGTKTKCHQRQETAEDFRAFDSFTLCELTTTSGKTHIGFFPSGKKEFIILCGAFDNLLTFNPVGAYDMSTLKRIERPLTITFN